MGKVGKEATRMKRGMAGLALLLLIGGLAPSVWAGNIVCSPSPLILAAPGAEGTVTVSYLGGGSGPIFGYSMQFTWDGAVVDAQSADVTEGGLLADIDDTVFFASRVGNTMSIDCALLGAQPGAEGPGTLFTVTFTGLAAGESPLDLILLEFREDDNTPITGIEEEDGSLRVEEGFPCEMLDVVDIGNPDSEALHALESWGPIEPLHSGGTYGGIENCRVVYASEANGDGTDWAAVRLVFGDCPEIEKRLTFQHLDGITNDAFELYMYPHEHPEESQLIYTYAGDGLAEEIWYEHSVTLAAAGRQVLVIVSTEEPWSGWATYGQVAFDSLYVELCEPLPLDVVDIGNPDSELGHALAGWGPIEPEASGGTFGGIADCRVAYASAANGDGEDWATVDLNFGEVETTKCLEIDHLDGAAQDSYEVYIYPAGHPEEAAFVFAYAGDNLTEEIWGRKRAVVTAACMQTVKIVSTGPLWGNWELYGQLAIDTLRVEACTPTAVFEQPDPGDLKALMQPAWPNPFRGETALSFSLPQPAAVELAVFDVAGRLVRRLAATQFGAGEQRLLWDGRNAEGEWVPAGVYLYRLDIDGEQAQCGKLVRLR
jgi:hypothetical protein